MICGHDLLERLSEERAHSKYIHMAFQEKAEEQAKKIIFAAERGRESRKGKELDHLRGPKMCRDEREKLRGTFEGWRSADGHELDVLVRRKGAG